jgi:hypothetical protein
MTRCDKSVINVRRFECKNAPAVNAVDLPLLPSSSYDLLFSHLD